MNGLIRAAKTETLKLTKRGKYKVFFLILLILYAALRVAANTAGTKGSGIVMGSFLLNYYLPFMAFLGVHDLISSEIRNRSIFLSLIAPVNRMTVYIAKCIAVWLLCALQMLALISIDYLFSFIGPMAGSSMQIVYALFDLIPLFTLIAFSAFISILFRNGAFSMLITLVLYAAMTLASPFVGLSPALFTSYLGWHTFLHGGMNLSGIMERILAVAAPCAVFLTLGAIMLERKKF